jgi:hypothetical protein
MNPSTLLTTFLHYDNEGLLLARGEKYADHRMNVGVQSVEWLRSVSARQIDVRSQHVAPDAISRGIRVCDIDII